MVRLRRLSWTLNSAEPAALPPAGTAASWRVVSEGDDLQIGAATATATVTGEREGPTGQAVLLPFKPPEGENLNLFEKCSKFNISSSDIQ